MAELTSPTEFKLPSFGVEPTTKRPLTAGEVTCELGSPPANPVEVTGTVAGSPTIAIALPAGFPTRQREGNVAVKLTGPEA